MTAKRWLLSVCVAATVLATSSLGMAQTSVARVNGTITDASGAVLSGVQVSIVNTQTGLARSVASNQSGRYVAPDLPPGTYELKASMEGFDTLVRSGITLTVGQDAAINLTMKIGSVSTQVTVVGDAPLVNTTSSGVSGVVEERRITELPLNGRDFAQLALTQPAALSVRTATEGASKGFGTRLSLSGSRPMDTGWTLDGTNVNSVGNFATPGSAAGVILGVDAIREFRVVTGGGYSAEYGGYSGGVVQMVTKSGTNSFHGTAFGLHRNDNVDARSFFDSDKPEFRRNQFGGSLGGRIVRDRLFVFGAYEGLRQAKTGEGLKQTVPDLNLRRGILPDGRQVTIAPEIKPYLDLWPLPNGASLGTGAAFRTTPTDQIVDENYYVARGDYHLTDNQSMFVRFTYDNGADSAPASLGLYANNNTTKQRFTTLQYENILSPSLLSSSLFAFNRTKIEPTITLNMDYPKNLFFLHHKYPPTLSFIGVNSFGVSDQPYFRIQNKWEASESLSLTKGNHSMKFGGGWSHIGFNTNGPAAGAFGDFQWTTAEDMLTDRVVETFQVEVPGADTARTVRQNVFSAYFQDDWQFRRNLTFNLGVRYEPWSSPSEKWGRVSTYRNWLTQTSFSHPTTDGTDHYFNSPGKTAVSPRVGFAWDVKGDGKTAIRGGAGIFHVEILSPYLNTIARKNPPDAGTIIASNKATNPTLATAGAFTLANGPAILSTKLTPTTFSEFITYDLDPMYEMKFNLTIEREIARDFSLALGYVGSRGIHLTQKMDCNALYPIQVNGRPFVVTSQIRPNPANGVMTCTVSDGQSFYNGMTVEVKKRLSNGFQLQSSYTWSKTIDDSTTGLGNSDFGEGLLSQPYNHKSDRGLSAIHLSHNIVINGLWSLPSPVAGHFASKLLGGWQLSGIFKASSGTPAPLKTGNRIAPDLSRTATYQRPELVPGRKRDTYTSGVSTGCAAVPKGTKLGTVEQYYDPCAFTLPPAPPAGLSGGFYGNAGRGIIIGPGFTNVDFSLKKNTPVPLGENASLQFHADVFNIFNHPNFGNPLPQVIRNNGAYVAGAGQITTTSGSERQMQFGLKLIF